MSDSNKWEIKPSICLTWGLIAFVLITVATICITVKFQLNLAEQHQEILKEQKARLEELKTIVNTVSKQSPSKGQAIQPINYKQESEEKSVDSYQNFLANYYTTQSNWLNTWLTILAISMGVMGIAVPIILADRKKDIEDTIKNAKETIEGLKAELTKAIESNIVATDDKLTNMDNKLKEVHEYVAKAKESENKAKASSLFLEGNRYHAEKKFDEAIENYTKAIKLNGNFKEAYNNRGVSYVDTGDYFSAIKDYEKVMEINSNDTDAYNNRGIAYIKQKKYSLAIADFNKIIELDSNFVKAYYNLAEAYIFNKEFDKALETLNQFQQKEKKPYIYNDDYDLWLDELNKSTQDAIVQQIIEIIKTKLTKKERK